MVSSRKRGREPDQMEDSAEPVAATPPKELTLLQKIRNTWEFANLAQWIFIFGRAVKIDENLDIDELEVECLKTRSTVLPEIGLALLKFVSSHRGLTPELFDEYTRRQYVAKAPQRNPFGVEEEPAKFIDFDVFTKLRVLRQLTQWTLNNPDRIRERMEEQKDSEQTIWRIEPFGWDRDDRTYIILDDNRLYRRTDPPPPPPPKSTPKPPKKNSKKAKAALRASKRQKLKEEQDSEPEAAEVEEADANPDADVSALVEKEDDGFGGMKWECIAVTFEEVHAFVASIEKSRDPNERILCKRVKDDLLPLLEKQEETRKRKAAQKERELMNLEKLATAKRSSRIAGKMEHQKAEEEAREADRKKQADLMMAKKEQEKWLKLEKERESRMMTREQRLKEREARRILHEDELANLSEDSKKIDLGTGRLSERHLKAEIERKKQVLEELAEEDDWIFDCICGAYGQIDDGTHSIACEKCNIWQHSKCLKVSQTEAERDDFHFICSTCQRRAIDAERAKAHGPIKITIKRPGSSSSPNLSKPNGSAAPVLPAKASPSHQASPPKPATQPYSGQPIQWQTPSTYSPGQPTMTPAQPMSNGSHSIPFPRPSSSHSFTSTSNHAQTPNPTNLYTNGTASGYITNVPNFPTPQQHHVSTYAPQQNASPKPPQQPQHRSPYPQMHHFMHTPAARATNGAPNVPGSDIRRNSITLNSSPTPVLTPAYKPALPANHSSSPPTHFTPSVQPKSLVPQSSPHLPPGQQIQAPNEILPPVATGYSPTKHSPPRPTTNGSSFGSATPSILLPVASLSPSPQLQNLSPPVKPSEPERPREYVSSVAPGPGPG